MVRIFNSLVQNLLTGFGKNWRRRISASKGSPLRAALMKST